MVFTLPLPFNRFNHRPGQNRLIYKIDGGELRCYIVHVHTYWHINKYYRSCGVKYVIYCTSFNSFLDRTSIYRVITTIYTYGTDSVQNDPDLRVST